MLWTYQPLKYEKGQKKRKKKKKELLRKCNIWAKSQAKSAAFSNVCTLIKAQSVLSVPSFYSILCLWPYISGSA